MRVLLLYKFQNTTSLTSQSMWYCEINFCVGLFQRLSAIAVTVDFVPRFWLLAWHCTFYVRFHEILCALMHVKCGE